VSVVAGMSTTTDTTKYKYLLSITYVQLTIGYGVGEYGRVKKHSF